MDVAFGHSGSLPLIIPLPYQLPAKYSSDSLPYLVNTIKAATRKTTKNQPARTDIAIASDNPLLLLAGPATFFLVHLGEPKHHYGVAGG